MSTTTETADPLPLSDAAELDWWRHFRTRFVDPLGEPFPRPGSMVLRAYVLKLAPSPADGIPLDEITTAPARTTDPTSSQMSWKNLSSAGARGKVALVFYKSAVHYEEPGLTPKAACKRAKIDHLSSPWKRVSDLKHAGIIAPTGTLVDGDRGALLEELKMTAFGITEVERCMADEAAKIRAMPR